MSGDRRGAVLAPVAARYATWLGLSRAEVDADREEPPGQIRALQLIVRMERDDPPERFRAVALAATGCAALCLDDRAAPGGPWHDAVADYVRGHIRKVTRRARGAQWQAVADLPGLDLTDGSTQVRVLVPGRVADLDPRVTRLQVGGTDVPPGPAPAGPVADGALRLWPTTLAPMTLGKAMAQAGHAGMIAAALLAAEDQAGLAHWLAAGLPAAVMTAAAPDVGHVLADPGAAWRTERLLAVRDAGFTEVAPGTVTVLARAGGRPAGPRAQPPVIQRAP